MNDPIIIQNSKFTFCFVPFKYKISLDFNYIKSLTVVLYYLHGALIRSNKRFFSQTSYNTVSKNEKIQIEQENPSIQNELSSNFSNLKKKIMHQHSFAIQPEATHFITSVYGHRHKNAIRYDEIDMESFFEKLYSRALFGVHTYTFFHPAPLPLHPQRGCT